jgi:CHASE3 domain sensor protein
MTVPPAPRAWPWSNLTILQQGLLLTAIPFLAQVLFIVLVTWVRWQGRDAQDWALHTQEVLAQAHTIHRSLVEAQDATRGYIIAPEKPFLDDYRRAIGPLPDQLAHLRELVRDNPDQQDLARTFTDHAEHYLVWLAESLPARDAAPNTEALQGRVRDGQVYLADLRRDLSAFLKEEERLDARRRRDLEASWRSLDCSTPWPTPLPRPPRASVRPAPCSSSAPPNWPRPTANCRSSPRSPPTTSRSRCARSRPSATACATGAAPPSTSRAAIT